MTFKIMTFEANDDEVSVTFEEAILLSQFCIFANVDLHTFSSYTVNMVIGALSVGTVQEVTLTWNTGTLNKG